MEDGALKRPLFGCSLLFALAAVFCAYFPDTNRHTAFAVCLFFVCAALVFLHKLRVLTAAMLLAAYLAGLLWFDCCARTVYAPCVSMAGYSGTIFAEAADYAEGRERYGVVNARLLMPDGDRVRALGEMTVYLSDGSPDIRPGDLMMFEGTLALPNDYGAGERMRFYTAKGVYLLAEQTGRMQLKRPERVPVRYAAKCFSHAVAERFSQLWPEEGASVMRALVTGDNGDIPPALRAAFSRSGTSHVVAVSGMHIAVLTGMVLFLFKGRAGALLSSLLVLLFTVLTGAPPSILRAAVMFFIAMAARLFRAEADALTAYGAALFVLVARNPYVVGDIGFVLTFLSTLGILLFCRPMTERIMKCLPEGFPGRGALVRFAVLPFCCTISAQIFTMPAVALAFGSVSLVSPLSNLAVPLLVTLLLPMGIVAALLSFLFPAGAAVAAAVAEPFLSLMLWLVKGFAALPYACVPVDDRIILCMLAALYLLWGAYRALGRFGVSPYLPAGLTVLLVVSGVVLSAVSWRGVLQIYLPDIAGGGTAAAVCDGRAVVVDCGAPNPARAAREAADFLSLRGVDGIDCLLLLSQEPGTQNGVQALGEMLPVKEVLAVHVPDGKKSAVSLGNSVKYISFTNVENRSYDGMNLTCYAQPGGSMLARLYTEDVAFLFATAGKAGIQQQTICEERLACDIMLIDDTFAQAKEALAGAVSAARSLYVIVRDNSYGREVPTRGINGGRAVSLAQSGDILITVR